jgi:sigma-B regulation protein RsbU (phosphoserine phosphatase)
MPFHMWLTAHPFALLGQVIVSQSRAELRWDFANTVAAAALLSAAVVALALFFFRRASRDLTLIYFAVLSSMYAVRLLIHLTSFRVLFDQPRAFWNYLDWTITCTIAIPLSLFFYQLADGRLRKVIRGLLILQMALAALGLLAAALQANLDTLNSINNISVFLLLGITALYFASGKWRAGPRQRLSHEFRVFIAGFLIWMAFAVEQNLVALLGVRSIADINVEVVGFLSFVACLGYVSAYRAFAKEERLLAIHKELEIARQIQASTLPQTIPALAGLEIAARYLPMSAVAGDFYDFLVVDGQHLGILVADVTGHGVPAALIASMLKVAFAGQAEHAADPALVLTGLNRALCGKFEEHFVTAAYLFVDLEKRVMRYSAAGHPPLMLLSHGADGAREIEENGLMLGLFPEAGYSSVEIPIQPGDRCMLYTDGIFEATNPAREEFGKPRCRQFLETEQALRAPRFAAALLEKVANFSGTNGTRSQDDDITLLVLDLHHPPSV